jgi:ankyrin repeat protein
MNDEQEQWLRALEVNNLQLCRDLIKRGYDVNVKVEAFLAPPLAVAAGEGYVEIAEVLLAHGAMVDEPKHSAPLYAACINGHVEIVRMLIKQGARIELAETLTPALSLAADRGDVAMCAVLVEAGSDLNEGSYRLKKTALMRAAKNNAVEVCQLLVASGADVHVTEESGLSALLVAAAADSVEAVRFLISAGADPSLALSYKRNQPLTAFQTAVHCNAVKVMEYFMAELGEDPSQRTEGGRTMLQLAGQSVEAKHLLQATKAARAVESSLASDQSALVRRTRQDVALSLL